MKTTYMDNFPSAKPTDVSRIDRGYIDPNLLSNIPGKCGEQLLFVMSPTGRMGKAEFARLTKSLSIGWSEIMPVTVFVEKSGSVVIFEGNHRLRAAIAAGIDAFVEIRWFGNSDRNTFFSENVGFYTILDQH